MTYGGEGVFGYAHSKERKRKISESQFGKKRGPYSEAHRKAISDSLKGKPFSEAHKRKLSEGHLGKKLSNEHKEKCGKHLIGKDGYWKGKKRSNSTKEKMSKSKFGIKIKQNNIQCPYCEKLGGTPNMKRYHFDNCKYKEVYNACDLD